MLRILSTIALLGSLLASTSHADTRVARDSAPCTLTTEGDLADRRFERPLALQMDYLLHVYASSGSIGESVAGQVLVTNRSQAELYFRCDVAFFAADGTLVGCLSWDANSPVKPGRKDASYSFTTAHIPRERIAAITAYKAVVYESDNLLGTESTRGQASESGLGQSQPVVIVLHEPQASSGPIGNVIQNRTRAACTFRDAEKHEYDPVVPIGSAAGLHLRLSPNLADQSTLIGAGNNRRPVKVRRWRLDSALQNADGKEFRSRPGSLYFVLLDATGGLVYSGRTNISIDQVPSAGLPPDQLFSATQLEAVAYTAP